MSFQRRRIDYTFQLSKGDFGVAGFDTVKVKGLRSKVSIQNANGPSMGEAQCRIYGLDLYTMNRLATVLRTPEGRVEYRFNKLIIEAGDDQVGMSKVFEGLITLSPIDMNDMPSSALVVIAHSGAEAVVNNLPPSSYPRSADAAVIMANLAAKGKYAFENNGVSVILATPYLPGSLRDQMLACASQANINWTIDNNTLAIWPKNGSRNGQVPLVSPDTGMYGYPTNWNMGVYVKTIFNPLLRIGRDVQVESSLPFANGRFNVKDIGHELEEDQPNGQWFTAFHATANLSG